LPWPTLLIDMVAKLFSTIASSAAALASAAAFAAAAAAAAALALAPGVGSPVAIGRGVEIAVRPPFVAGFRGAARLCRTAP